MIGPFPLEGAADWSSLVFDGGSIGDLSGGFRLEVASDHYDPMQDFNLSASEPSLDQLAAATAVMFGMSVDVRPSVVRMRGAGLLPVAILGSADFDVDTVDVTAVTLGPGSAFPAQDPDEDVTRLDHTDDVNGDGYLDLMLHFSVQDAGITQGLTALCLTAITYGGELVLRSCDPVEVR